MAKKAYIGVNGVARKIKKGYIGVDGKARKIKKAYIGDENGIARLFFSSGLKMVSGTTKYVSGGSVTINTGFKPMFVMVYGGTKSYGYFCLIHCRTPIAGPYSNEDMEAVLTQGISHVHYYPDWHETYCHGFGETWFDKISTDTSFTLNFPTSQESPTYVDTVYYYIFGE